MKRPYTHILVMVLSFLSFLMGCTSKKHHIFDEKESAYICGLESQISTNPQFVIDEVNSILPVLSDSLTYYQLLLLKSKSMFYLAELDSVKSLLDSALPYFLRHDDEEDYHGLSSVFYNMLGSYYSRLTIMDSANYYFKHAFVSARKSSDHTDLPPIAINVADSYISRGIYDLASFWYWKSLSLDDSLKIPEPDRYPTYLGLAKVHMELQDFAACDSFYQKAGRSFDQMEPFEKHSYLNNRGHSYFSREDYQTALQYYRQSQQLVSQWPHMEFERNLTYVNLGKVFLLLNEVDSAAYYLNNCHEFFKKINNASVLYCIDTQLIELAVKQKNLPMAKKRVEEAMTLGYVEPEMLQMRNLYLQHYYEEKGRFKHAYFFQKENKRIDDSIRNDMIQMRSSEMALRYKYENRLMQNEILLRQQENKVLRLNQWLYVVIFGTLAMSAFLWGFFLYKRRKEEKKLWSMQTSINSLRLDNVRNRISPHFIFNVLNHEMNRLKNEKDKENLLILIHLLRRQLELVDQISISLADEMDFVQNFLKLERTFIEGEVDLIIKIDSEIDEHTLLIPSMAIYILVENAVKHSLRLKEGEKKLWINVCSVDERVEIKVCDNGGGFQLGSSSQGTGTGFKVITRFIQLYNQYNKEKIYMNIRNVEVGNGEKGCEVSYSIPKDYNFSIKS